MSCETTYGQGISNAGGQIKTTDQALANRTHLKTSILFGSQNTNYKSEAKAQFLGEKTTQNNQGLTEKAREQHIKFEDRNGNTFISQTKSNFDYKGDPSQIKAVLDADRQADLRTHHFSYGNHANEFKENKEQPKPHVELAKPILPKKKGKDSVFFNSSPKRKDDFKTSNQTFVKWISPQPQVGMA
jgi:hypothetical protein